MWFSVVCTLTDNDTRHHSGQNVVDSWGAAKWVHNKLSYRCTSQSARFSLVIEYVRSIHPWANSSCLISQSERVLCFSYVINIYFNFPIAMLYILILSLRIIKPWLDSFLFENDTYTLCFLVLKTHIHTCSNNTNLIFWKCFWCADNTGIGCVVCQSSW